MLRIGAVVFVTWLSQQFIRVVIHLCPEQAVLDGGLVTPDYTIPSDSWPSIGSDEWPVIQVTGDISQRVAPLA